MRIPLSKVYRAFEELDPFSDEECERFVLRAERSEATLKEGPRIVGGILGAMIGVLLVALGALGVAVARSGGLINPDSDAATTLLVALAFFMVIAGGSVGSLCGRDWWLRRAIAGKLSRSVCPGCKYSLLGLTITDSDEGPEVRCPECGRTLRLGEFGLAPEDLIARTADAAPRE